MPKPFVPGHLSGAVRAALRTRDPDSILQMATSIRVGDVLFDAERREVRWDDGFRVRFSAREWELLAVLLGHANRYFTAEELRDAAWRDASLGTDQVRGYVYRLRRKLEGRPLPCRLVTSRGLGYCLRLEAAPAPRGRVGPRTRPASSAPRGAVLAYTPSGADRPRSGARPAATGPRRGAAWPGRGPAPARRARHRQDRAPRGHRRGRRTARLRAAARARGHESESGLPYAGMSELHRAGARAPRRAARAVQEHALAGALALAGGEPPGPLRRRRRGAQPVRRRCRREPDAGDRWTTSSGSTTRRATPCSSPPAACRPRTCCCCWPAGTAWASSPRRRAWRRSPWGRWRPPRPSSSCTCAIPTGIAPAVARQLLATAQGNPLALAELPSLLTPDQLAGRTPTPDPLPSGATVERAFRRQLTALPERRAQALLVCAADEHASLAELEAAFGGHRPARDGAGARRGRGARARRGRPRGVPPSRAALRRLPLRLAARAPARPRRARRRRSVRRADGRLARRARRAQRRRGRRGATRRGGRRRRAARRAGLRHARAGPRRRHHARSRAARRAPARRRRERAGGGPHGRGGRSRRAGPGRGRAIR